VVATRAGIFYGQAMTAGDIYSVAGNGTSGFSGAGGPALNAVLSAPGGMVLDKAGNTVIAASGASMVAVVAARTGRFYGKSMTVGDIYRVAGDGIQGFSGNGGLATKAEINRPRDVAVDGAGNIVIADTWNNRIRVVAASSATFYGKAMKTGHIYTVAGDGQRGVLLQPAGVAVDAAGNVVIADSLNQRIRVLRKRPGRSTGWR
jgi:sugar lactone lactonase YvrE